MSAATTMREDRSFRSLLRLPLKVLRCGILALSIMPVTWGGSLAAERVSAPTISGFRGADFGMTERQVRAAIIHDLGLRNSDIHAGENAIQKTGVLSVLAPNLLPKGGRAEVDYVFGYRSRRLIEVNILWSRATDPAITPAQLVRDGEVLQNYFHGEGFPQGQSAANLALPGGILLFRTASPAGRTILLVLSGIIAKDQKTGKDALHPTALRLSYAENAKHPDVYRLKTGSF